MSTAFHSERRKQAQGKVIYDQFYTKPEVVKQCLSKIDLGRYDCVVEPSAGAGAFLEDLHHSNIYAMDIAPMGKGIARRDYLSFWPGKEHENVLVVGNPPFGMYHALSDAFLAHSFSFENADTVGFILPNTYHKHTRQKIIPQGWRIKSITRLGRDAFVYNGESRHVPCSFFVFDRSKGKDLRFNPALHKEAVDFSFGTPDDYEFFMFGSSPTKIISKPKPNNRGYYIKPKTSADKVIERIQSINWEGHSCAQGGVAWFTKAEVVAQYNQVYG